MLNNPVYLDYNATTPVAVEVMQVMLPYFTEKFGNASSKTHAYGWVAAEAVDFARGQVAELIGATADEIIFTSGATEAINLAIKGVAEIYKKKGRHIIVAATEHKAVLDSVAWLASKGYKTSYISVGTDGRLDPGDIERAITSETILICMMAANNETGVIQPVEKIGEIAGNNGVLFLCDATQLFGKSRLTIYEMHADMLCLSAHKMYGPKGTGALYCRRKNPKVKLTALIHGGGQEKGLRSGTLNVPGIVGFGEACKLAATNWWDDAMKTSAHRTAFEQKIVDLGDVFINGSVKYRLPNTTNLLFRGISSSSLIRALPGLSFSAGSACSSLIPEPSHVLLAMGLSPADADCSVRFSLGRNTTEEEINFAIERVQKAVVMLRK